MSDLTRKQIEEARGLGRDRLTNSEWLQLCDMALRTLDAEARNRELEGENERLWEKVDVLERDVDAINKYAMQGDLDSIEDILRGETSAANLSPSPSDSEPAEGEGGDPDHSRDFDGIDPRGMGPLPGEPGNPNPSFEQMDVMLERREALEAFEALANGGWMLMKGVLRRENEGKVRHYLSRTSDEGTGYNEVAGEVYQAVGVLLSDAGRFDDPDGIALLDACSYLAGNRDNPPDTLLPFESKGTECVVPEAVRQLSERWRQCVPEITSAQRGSYMLGAYNTLIHCADELDRALAQHREKNHEG